jgi:hypothetical protein
MVRLPWSDACRLAQGRDALISWRALFEPFDNTQVNSASWSAFHRLASSPLMRPDGASMVLGPFASTTIVALFETHQAKPRLPGRNPATQNITLKQ